MWCKRCQQDVPGIAAGDGAIGCARCASTLRAAAAPPPETEGAPSVWGKAMSAESFAPPIDDWPAEDALRHAEFVLDRVAPHLAEAARLTAPAASREQVAPAKHKPPKSNQPRGGALAWLFLLAGTMALVCGGVLAGWSLAAPKPHLWDLGLPILLGGQAALLVGICLQLERMWHNGRLASERLAEVDRELGDLQHTTTLLGNTYGAGSSAFYAHMAQGASPHLLLSDLKSQIDLLAMKVSR